MMDARTCRTPWCGAGSQPCPCGFSLPTLALYAPAHTEVISRLARAGLRHCTGYQAARRPRQRPFLVLHGVSMESSWGSGLLTPRVTSHSTSHDKVSEMSRMVSHIDHNCRNHGILSYICVKKPGNCEQPFPIKLHSRQ